MSKEFLLEQIALKAKAEADEIVGSAEESAAIKRRKINEELESEYESKLDKIKKEAEQIVLGQKTLLRIEASKAELKVKRELIDEVYKGALDRIIALSDDEYRKFISSLISKYAEENDKLIISRKDASRLTSDWLSDLAFDLQLTLSFADEYHDDVGGIILRGEKYDKNLTLTAIISETRKTTENAIADRLFG